MTEVLTHIQDGLIIEIARAIGLDQSLPVCAFDATYSMRRIRCDVFDETHS